MDILKEKYFLLVSVLSVLFMFFFFGVYMLPTFQTDTYAKWFYSLESYINQCFMGARYGEALYVWISFQLLGNPVHHRFIHVALACFINAAVTVEIWRALYTCMKLEKKNAFVNVLIIFSTISMRANVFNSDIFQYGYDAAVTFLGDSFAVLAGVIISRRCGWKNYIKACILAIIAVSFRQTCLFWFVLMAMLLYFCEYAHRIIVLGESGWMGEAIKSLVRRIGVYIVAGSFSILCIRFLVQGSVRGSLARINLKASWYEFCVVMKRLFINSMELLPKYYYAVILLIMVIMLLTYILKFNTLKKVGVLIIAVLTLSGIFLASFITVVFDAWLVHRVIVGYHTLLAVMIVMEIELLQQEEKHLKKIMCFLYTILIPFIFISWFFSLKIFCGQVITNASDIRSAEFYYEQIIRYERETGIEIKNVAYLRDKNYTEKFPGVIASKSINERAFSTPWAQREIMCLIKGKRLIVVQFNENLYNSEFADKDWDTLSEEQVKCIGDTAYIMLY